MEQQSRGRQPWRRFKYVLSFRGIYRYIECPLPHNLTTFRLDPSYLRLGFLYMMVANFGIVTISYDIFGAGTSGDKDTHTDTVQDEIHHLLPKLL